MKTTIEATLAILAAMLVLFSSMWDPRVSAMIAVLALAGFGLYKLLGARKSDPERRNGPRP